MVLGCDAEGATTTCYVENEHGRCEGQAACVAIGELSECDAAAPAQEICNGIDDDCDGEIDEEADECTNFYLDTDGDQYGQGLPSFHHANHLAQGLEEDFPLNAEFHFPFLLILFFI